MTIVDRDHNKTGISYSMINTAYYCLKKYEYLYVDKIKPEAPTGGDLEFGKAIHSAIEAMLEGEDGVQTFDVYWQAARLLDIKYNRFSWEYLNELAPQLLIRFSKGPLRHIKPLICEERLYGSLGDIQLEGTPDVVGTFKDKLSVIDFKTAKGPYHRDQILVNEQLYLYAELYRQKTGVLPEQVVYLVLCKNSPRIQTLTFPLTAAKHESMLDNIQAVCYDLKERKRFPRNRKTCIMGTFKCEFFSKCYPKEERE